MPRNIGFCALAFIAAGCDSQLVVPVSGRVTLNGVPVENAIVLFQPFDEVRPNPGTGSTGRTDADGRFTLRQIQPDRPGARPGRHWVTIRQAPIVGSREEKPGAEVKYSLEEPEVVVPEKGTSAVNLKVQIAVK